MLPHYLFYVPTLNILPKIYPERALGCLLLKLDGILKLQLLCVPVALSLDITAVSFH